jgi:vitamin B12 transporter
VVTAEQIESRQLRTVGEVLRSIGGVDIVRTGSQGAMASIYMRGANPRETLVLVDGIDVSDPSDSSGGADLAHMSTEDIQRIEVLRGPASSFYGSSAMGGIIRITTRRGSGPLKARVSAGGGSFKTFDGWASASGGSADADYALSGSYMSVGMPANISAGGPVPAVSPYQRTVISGRADLLNLRPFEAGLVLRYTESSLGLNGYDYDTYQPVADPNYTQAARQLLVAPSFHEELSNGRWIQDLIGSFSWNSRVYENLSDSSDDPYSRGAYTGRRFALEWKNTVRLAEGNQALALLGARRDEAATSTLDRAIRTFSAALQDQQQLFGSLTLRAGGRVDDYQIFGTAWTYTIAASQELPVLRTLLRTSWGTGFKPPTIYERFDPKYGNPDLKAERSRSFEAGLEQPLLHRRLSLGAGFFWSQIRDLLDYDPMTYQNVNVPGLSRVSGVESFATVKLGETSLRVDYTWTRAVGADGNDLARRPRHKASAWVDFQGPRELTLSAGARYVGDRNNDNLAQTIVPAYWVASLAASYPLVESVTLSARIENLFDQRYEEARGYPAPGFGAYAMLKVER